MAVCRVGGPGLENERTGVAARTEASRRDADLVDETGDIFGGPAAFVRITHVDRHVDFRDTARRMPGGTAAFLNGLADGSNERIRARHTDIQNGSVSLDLTGANFGHRRINIILRGDYGLA